MESKIRGWIAGVEQIPGKRVNLRLAPAAYPLTTSETILRYDQDALPEQFEVGDYYELTINLRKITREEYEND